MNKIIIIIIFIITHYSIVNCQSEKIYDSAQKHIVENFLTHPENDLEVDHFRILLHLNYSERYIKNVDNIASLYSGKVQQINLYYSDFPKNKSFKKLNIGRIEYLLEKAPQLRDTSIRWKMIEQSDCSNEIEAAKLFHGFEIILKYSDDIKLTTVEIDTAFQDFVVDKVLKRNNWREMLIVSDITGSMSPYIAQLFLWLKLNTIDDRIKQFVFFNDGDTKLDINKEIGNTGGIYQTKSKDYDEIEKVAIQCMLSGYGGDSQENDIEAILAGLKLCPDCRENILIADNNSPIRDLKLLKKIEKPIRIIICGSYHTGTVNIEYLNLARETGGSIHLMEKDLFNLIQLNEGEELEIYGITYKIYKNKFVKIIKS